MLVILLSDVDYKNADFPIFYHVVVFMCIVCVGKACIIVLGTSTDIWRICLVILQMKQCTYAVQYAYVFDDILKFVLKMMLLPLLN